MISGMDSEVLALWEKHGIPDDRSTLECAARMCLRLWAALQEQEAVVADLLARWPEVAA